MNTVLRKAVSAAMSGLAVGLLALSLITAFTNTASAQCNVQQQQSVSQAAAVQNQAVADILRLQQLQALSVNQPARSSATAVAGGGASNSIPQTIAQLRSLAAQSGSTASTARATALPPIDTSSLLALNGLSGATAVASALPPVDQQAPTCNGGGCNGGRSRSVARSISNTSLRQRLLPQRSVSRSVAVTRTSG
jgi:hypothetical protein